MKKLILIVAVAFCSAFVFAQENVIKVNPLALLGGTDLVSYERALGEHSSFQIGGAIGGFKLGGSKYTSAGGGVMYRYYFNEALSKWYGGIIVGYQGGNVKYEFSDFGDSSGEDKIKFSGINAGLRVGYQFSWDSGFVLDLNAGIGYRNLKYKYEDDQDEEFYNNTLKGGGVLPGGTLGIGYRF